MSNTSNLVALEQAKRAAEQAVKNIRDRLEQLDKYWATSIGVTEMDERITLRAKLEAAVEQAKEIAEAYLAKQQEVADLRATYDAVDADYRKVCSELDTLARKHADKIAKALTDWQDKALPLWEDHKRARMAWAKATGNNSGSTSEYSPYEMARKVPGDVQNAILFGRGD